MASLITGRNNYFGYNTGKSTLPAGVIKISPSGLSRFFDNTSQWYRETLLKEKPAFTGNTASVLGTCVHGLAAMHVNEGLFDFSLVEEYLNTITDPEIDLTYIRKQYPVMARALIHTHHYSSEAVAEPFVQHEVVEGVWAAGSIDLLLPEEIVDYKTTGATTAPTSVSRAYWFQQMTYAWILKQQGYNIKKFHLKYVTHSDINRVSEKTGKALKDYPSVVSTVTHEISGDDYALIDGVLRLVAESSKTFVEKPELRHLLAQDMRLKEIIPRKMFG